uniref:G-protein coupled receptors family 2 profile 1 domain-containing protein n=1 Tax=Romanomermis culicivorax TaxID=13658 RepID=A0A915KIG0_ROMCU
MKCYRNEEEIYHEIWHRANKTCSEKNGPDPGVSRKLFWQDAKCPGISCYALLAGNWCPGVYDGWNCWNHTAPGTLAYADCSVISQFDEVDGK